MAKKHTPRKYEISREFEGNAYNASYFIQSKMVTLECKYGTKSTQLGTSPPQTLARLLFGEALRDAKARGEL